MQKFKSVEELVNIFEKRGNTNINACVSDSIEFFNSEEWILFSESKNENILLCYRLAFLSEIDVNWCPKLGTVLANDEVVDGLSERGGHEVVRKKMTQWSIRISAFSERLLEGLKNIDWPDPLKEMQRNWIGKSEGVSFHFEIKNNKEVLEVFEL